MPPVLTRDTTPDALRPFTFHKVNVEWSGGSQAIGDCPFCGKEQKLYVSVQTGLHDCKVCGISGNHLSFLRKFYEFCDQYTGHDALKELASERKLLYYETLMYWGVVLSPISGHWLLPGWGIDGKLQQLYKWTPILKDGKWTKRLLPTPGVHQEGNSHRLFHSTTFNYDAKVIYTAEGPWDGMALWEMLRSTKRTDEGLKHTAAEATSIFGEEAAEVVAVPGCKQWHEIWCKLYSGRKAILGYDSDQPREHLGKVYRDGWDGMKRVSQIFAQAETPPSEIHIVKWGENGYDPTLPTGYDMRDHLAQGGSSHTGRCVWLESLLSKISPIPGDWLEGRSLAAKKAGSTDLEPLPCTEWSVLINSCKKAMDWIDGLERAFSAMFAVIVSTGHEGSQLWFKFISPGSSGKSTLCEALSANRQHVVAESQFTALFSGYKTDKSGTEDHGLVARLKNKTLVVKEGDAFMNQSNNEKTMAQLRDLYDKVSRVSYGNAIHREYRDFPLTFILCGTQTLRKLDQSELGGRFLVCSIIDKIDQEVEKRVAIRSAYNTRFSFGRFMNCSAESTDSPARIEMKRLTAGYINYLRDNAPKLLSQVVMSDAQAQFCTNLAIFIAYLRARPSKVQDEQEDREYAPRLTETLTLLTGCLTVVLNKTVVDAEIMRRVKSYALDTANGKTLDIVKHLYRAGHDGLQFQSICHLMGWGSAPGMEKSGGLLSFLKKIGAAEHFVNRDIGMSQYPRWRLTDELTRLCREVLGPPDKVTI